jgi:hypothetical protein
MNKRLLKVAAYLKSQGFYREASEIKNIALNNAQDNAQEEWMKDFTSGFTPQELKKRLLNVRRDFLATIDGTDSFLFDEIKYPQYKDWGEEGFKKAVRLINDKLNKITKEEIVKLNIRLETAKEELSELQEDYEPTDPYVTKIQSIISDLEKQIENALQDMKDRQTMV